MMTIPQYFFRRLVTSKMLFIAFLMVFICFAPAFGKTQLADVTIGTNDIQVKSAAPGVTFLMLRVVNPEGEMVCDQSTSGYPIYWALPAGSSNGSYSYEVRAGKEPKKSGRNDEIQIRKTKTRTWNTSGGFWVQNSAILTTGLKESGVMQKILGAGGAVLTMVMDVLIGSAYADVVHLDDVVITGSLGVGFDILTDGTEDFGFDTFRLKENNLQIHFDDTSASAGFPANDWKIICNDSTSGGLNYFSVQDDTADETPFKIEAGAPNNSLYIEDYGRIGIGTSTPYVEIHVVDGDSPTLRMDQDGSSGWSPQAWDMCGNESNFFIKDVTNSSKLPFRIQPGTPTNSLTLKNDGRVGLGTWSPEADLELERTGTDARFLVQRTDGASGGVTATADKIIIGSTTNYPIQFVANNVQVMSISQTGNAIIAGNLELGSSREIKENIESLETEEALKTLTQLQPVKFNYKTNNDDQVLGFIAEDVPDLVATQSRRTTSPMDMVAVLTKVVQEQQKTIEKLSLKVAALEKGRAPAH